MTTTDLPTIALCTLQFGAGGLIDCKPVDGYTAHLVRQTERGTPGPTLCGIDRFHRESAGWSVGGGTSGPGITHPACSGCVEVAARDFPGLPITGYVGAESIRRALADLAAR